MILVLWSGKTRFVQTFDREPLRFVDNSVQKVLCFGESLWECISDHEEQPKLSDMNGELCDVLIVNLLENVLEFLGNSALKLV